MRDPAEVYSEIEPLYSEVAQLKVISEKAARESGAAIERANKAYHAYTNADLALRSLLKEYIDCLGEQREGKSKIVKRKP